MTRQSRALTYNDTPQAVCFLVPEIVSLICDEVQTLPESRDSNKSLAVLARTCRFFHKPAVVRLWYDLQSLAPLIMCMPDDLWQVQELRGDCTDLQLCRDIHPTDFTRALQYASHIRRFGFCKDFYVALPELQSTVYKAIREAAVLAGEVLLPNITALKLAELSIFPHIEYFMGPFIETLELPMSIDQGLLSTIVTRYPTLQHVNFTEWSGRSKPEVVNVVSAAICGWSQFQTLSINGLTSSALTHVASLSNLQCLTLQYLDDSTCTLPVSAFPALRSLTLRAETPLQCVKFMENLKLRCITKVALFFKHATCSGWTALVDVLLQSCNPLSLLGLSLQLLHTGEGRCRAESQIMQPLFVLSNLTSVEIGPCQGLDNRFIRRLSKAWPRLKNLFLLGKMLQSQGATSRVTLPGLVPLAKACPDLERLAILLDTLNVHEYRSRPGGGVRNFSVKSLHVGYSPMTSTHLIAHFLSDIFPNITDLDGSCCYGGSWEAVEKLTRLLASVRLQEQVYQTEKRTVTGAQNDT